MDKIKQGTRTQAHVKGRMRGEYKTVLENKGRPKGNSTIVRKKISRALRRRHAAVNGRKHRNIRVEEKATGKALGASFELE